MRATLWQGATEASAITREVLRGLFKLAGINFDVVDTQEALLAATTRSRRGNDAELLVIDCLEGQPADIDRCIAVASQTPLRLYIVHPRAAAVRQVEEVAGRSTVWVPTHATMCDLLDLLHGLRGLVNAVAARGERPALTEREREVAALLADGHTNAEIAADLHITEDTVKTHVQAIMQKFSVTSRRAFGRVYRADG
jgi:DNA-binding CsgD family transcriptional regulator